MVNRSQWEIVKIAFQYSLKICLQNKSGKTKIINKKKYTVSKWFGMHLLQSFITWG